MTAEKFQDQEFVEHVVKLLVDNPDDVKVERKIDEMGVLITMDVNPADMGMVIGRDGMTAKALRTLLRVIGARSNARVNLKINEPEGSERRERNDRGDRGDRNDRSERRDRREETPREEKKTIDEVVGDLDV